MQHLAGPLLACALALACASPPPAATTPGPPRDTAVITTITEYGEVEAGPAAERCATLREAQDLTRKGFLEKAEVRLGEMLAAFAELEAARGVPLVAFANQDEYDHYATTRDPSSFAPVDWCYRELYQLQAFIHVERKHYPAALASLRRAADVGPTAAATHAERGFVLNRIGDFEQARRAYERALALATEYSASAAERPVALRGLGFSLIELGDLEAAEQAFRASLELDPGHALAENELQYIQRLRAQRGR